MGRPSQIRITILLPQGRRSVIVGRALQLHVCRGCSIAAIEHKVCYLGFEYAYILICRRTELCAPTELSFGSWVKSRLVCRNYMNGHVVLIGLHQLRRCFSMANRARRSHHKQQDDQMILHHDRCIWGPTSIVAAIERSHFTCTSSPPQVHLKSTSSLVSSLPQSHFKSH